MSKEASLKLLFQKGFKVSESNLGKFFSGARAEFKKGGRSGMEYLAGFKDPTRNIPLGKDGFSKITDRAGK